MLSAKKSLLLHFRQFLIEICHSSSVFYDLSTDTEFHTFSLISGELLQILRLLLLPLPDKKKRCEERVTPLSTPDPIVNELINQQTSVVNLRWVKLLFIYHISCVYIELSSVRHLGSVGVCFSLTYQSQSDATNREILLQTDSNRFSIL